ncbi:aspartate racemase [Candidatus Woesearchaeota archaeon]|nr:aspartate racemase [Candidatus Woesearchaeota archaeon]
MIIGILGGLGPEATKDLYEKIIQTTPAKCDQDHIEIIIYNNPKIPDRTQAILYNGENPLPQLIHTAKTLEKAGAELIVIPCNTAHYFLDKLQPRTPVPILNMIEETAAFIHHNYPDTKKVGILATTGTIKTNLYQKTLQNTGIMPITPSTYEQESLIMEAIYGTQGIKRGKKTQPRKLLLKAAQSLTQQGAQLIILGCTEIPLALRQKEISSVLINPANILAEKIITLTQTKKQKVII